MTKEALKLLRATIRTSIEIHQKVKSGLGNVLADPNQIHQIVMNLVTNASHAMDSESGEIEVNLKRVEITGEDASHRGIMPGPYLNLTVADSGHGMDNRTISRIFEPYFTTKEVGEGTGMGLAVVHGIVNDHSGHISVYSEPGVGTRFEILLPLIEARVNEIVESENSLEPGTERILFVDDEEAIVSIGKDMLERLGYKVDTWTNSLEALEYFRSKPDSFDLIITDMTMPKMTGKKLSSEIKKIRDDIPIILCTGFSNTNVQEHAADVGVKGFLSKPITIQDLAKTVREILDN